MKKCNKYRNTQFKYRLCNLCWADQSLLIKLRYSNKHARMLLKWILFNYYIVGQRCNSDVITSDKVASVLKLFYQAKCVFPANKKLKNKAIKRIYVNEAFVMDHILYTPFILIEESNKHCQKMLAHYNRMMRTLNYSKLNENII